MYGLKRLALGFLLLNSKYTDAASFYENPISGNEHGDADVIKPPAPSVIITPKQAHESADCLFSFLGDFIKAASLPSPDNEDDMREVLLKKGAKPLAVIMHPPMLERVREAMPPQLNFLSDDTVNIVRKIVEGLEAFLQPEDRKSDAHDMARMELALMGMLAILAKHPRSKSILKFPIITLSDLLLAQIDNLDLSRLINLQVLIGSDRGFKVPILGDLFDCYLRVEFFKRRMLAGYLRAAPIRCVFYQCSPTEMEAQEDRACKQAILMGGPGLHKLMQLLGGKMRDPRLSHLLVDFKDSIPSMSSQAINRMLDKAFGNSKHFLHVVKAKGDQNNASVAVGMPIILRKDNQAAFMKIKRDDARIALEYELRAVTELSLKDATDENPVPKTSSFLNEILRGWLEELDWYKEVKNIALGRRLYANRVRGIESIECLYALPPADPVVLILSRAKGVTLNSYLRRLSPTDQTGLMEALQLSGALLKLWFEEAIFSSGYFHADLHDGNLMYDYQPRGVSTLTIIDYGSVKRLKRGTQTAFLAILVEALWWRNANGVVSALRAGATQTKTNEFKWDAFQASLQNLLNRESPPPRAANVPAMVIGPDGSLELPPSKLAAVADLLEEYPEMPLPDNLIQFIRSLVMLETLLNTLLVRLGLATDHKLAAGSIMVASIKAHKGRLLVPFCRSVCGFFMQKLTLRGSTSPTTFSPQICAIKCLDKPESFLPYDPTLFNALLPNEITLPVDLDAASKEKELPIAKVPEEQVAPKQDVAQGARVVQEAREERVQEAREERVVREPHHTDGHRAARQQEVRVADEQQQLVQAVAEEGHYRRDSEEGNEEERAGPTIIIP